MKLAIVLTGTVRPQVKGGAWSIDERERMYLSTLRYYSETIGHNYPIVFVENSDVDISHWGGIFAKSLNLEVIQFPPDRIENSDFNNSQGKGYNEFLMIKKAMLKSKVLSVSTHFLKITGRYPMVNIIDIIKEIENRAENKVFFGDIKDTRIYDWIGIRKTDSGHWGDSRFFMADVDFYKRNIIDCYKEMNDYNGHNAENFIYNLSKKYRNDPRFIHRYRTQVRFDGVCGLVTDSFSESYNSPKARIKGQIRQCLRYLFPYIWF